MIQLLFALLGTRSSFAISNAAFANDRLYEHSSDGSPAISLIHSARSSIDMEIYTMKDLKVIAELKSAVLRGVKLRIVQTSLLVGDACQVFNKNDPSTPEDCRNLRSFIDFVKQHGGHYQPFSYALCGVPGKACYQHGKMLIIDQKEAMISTGNFDPTSLCDLAQGPDHCNRDFSMTTTDPKSVHALLAIFNKDMVSAPYDLLSILQTAPHVTASPLSMKPLINFINSARVSIQIENQYLNDPTMNAALIAAAHRGVKVYVMVSSVVSYGRLDSADDRSKIQQWTDTYTSFDHAGVSSRIFDDHMKVSGQPGYLHAKVILVDSVHAWVGSVNGSTKSLTENREFGLFSDDRVLTKKLSEILYDDFVNENGESWLESLACTRDACSRSHTSDKDGDADPPETLF